MCFLLLLSFVIYFCVYKFTFTFLKRVPHHSGPITWNYPQCVGHIKEVGMPSLPEQPAWELRIMADRPRGGQARETGGWGCGRPDVGQEGSSGLTVDTQWFLSRKVTWGYERGVPLPSDRCFPAASSFCTCNEWSDDERLKQVVHSRILEKSQKCVTPWNWDLSEPT